MPELPEVETIVNELNSKIKEKTIKSIQSDNAKSTLPSLKILFAKTKGKKIKEVRRRGKLIDINLGGDDNILIHLKMTGQLVYVDKVGKEISGGHSIDNLGKLPNKFSHVIISFIDGSVLYFNDIRKFGWVKYATNIERDIARQKYGLEPFDEEYTLGNFIKIIKRYPRKKIKQFLLDQKKISGLGNIYADEVLFASHILPTRLVGSLNSKEIELLYKEIPKILKFAISKGGTTADNYVRTDGSRGEMINFLKVYGREAKKCKRCSGIIRKIKLGGRGTHFCKFCQK